MWQSLFDWPQASYLKSRMKEQIDNPIQLDESTNVKFKTDAVLTQVEKILFIFTFQVFMIDFERDNVINNKTKGEKK